jgi:hypothetical protein
MTLKVCKVCGGTATEQSRSEIANANAPTTIAEMDQIKLSAKSGVNRNQVFEINDANRDDVRVVCSSPTCDNSIGWDRSENAALVRAKWDEAN